MAHKLTTSFLEDSVLLFRYYKGLAEKAIAQVSDEQLVQVLDAEMNSIAVTVKHMTGNMRESGWNCVFSALDPLSPVDMTHGFNPRRAALAGYQSPDCALRVPLRTDCLPGEALSTR